MKDENPIISPDAEKNDRIPPGQSNTKDFPVLQYGQVPIIDIDKWTFTISGLGEKEMRLNFKEFTVLPQVKVVSDIHCVTGWSKLDNLWEGVSTETIRGLVNIKPEAKFVLVRSVGGFTANLSFEDFFADDVLFALKHNGETITPDHGYPVRLVVPCLYFWKSAKWVVGVEFLEKDKRGFWESVGYHNHGDPWKEERYSSQE